MNNVNKKIEENSSIQKAPKEFFCPRCNASIEIGAKICSKCGSPTRRLSGFCHVHRSMITAIGSFFAIIGVAVLIYNLVISSKTLEHQQKTFIEDYKPRFRLDHELPERAGADSIRFILIFGNSGKTDAIGAREQVTLTTLPDSATHTLVFKQDIVPKRQPINNKCQFPVAYGRSFIIKYLATYKWAGEKEKQQFEYYFFALFDENTDQYSFNVLDKSTIAGIWDIRKSLLEKQ